LPAESEVVCERLQSAQKCSLLRAAVAVDDGRVTVTRRAGCLPVSCTHPERLRRDAVWHAARRARHRLRNRDQRLVAGVPWIGSRALGLPRPTGRTVQAVQVDADVVVELVLHERVHRFIASPADGAGTLVFTHDTASSGSMVATMHADRTSARASRAGSVDLDQDPGIPELAERWKRSGGADHPPEHEVRGSNEAETCPQEIELERLLEVEYREGHEHAQRDDFLHDLELRDRKDRVADAVGRYLQQVLEQRDPPAHK